MTESKVPLTNSGRSGSDPVLAVRGLSHHFTSGSWPRRTRQQVLHEVGFELHSGEVLAVVGESGSGKSTIARIIARLVKPSAGEVRLHGRDVMHDEPHSVSREYRRSVQLIFQDPFASLNPVHTVEHHLSRPLAIHHRLTQTSARGRVRSLLDTVGLSPADEFARKYPHECSGGQRQRVAIARALAVDPRVLLADEPVSMLDVSIRAGILDLLDRLRRERSLSILYITHDLASARYFADRTLVLYAGQVVEQGPSDALLQAPAHPYTRQLVAAVPDPSRPFRGLAHAAASPANTLVHAPAPPATSATARGCSFAARCPDVLPRCTEAAPQLVELGRSRWVRCHVHGEASTNSERRHPEPPPHT